MNRIYCSDEDRALHDIAKDIVMSRNVCLVVPSSKYISYAVSVLRNAFDTIMKAKIVDVHETQDSTVIEAEITGCFDTDKLAASVYTLIRFRHARMTHIAECISSMNLSV